MNLGVGSAGVDVVVWTGTWASVSPTSSTGSPRGPLWGMACREVLERLPSPGSHLAFWVRCVCLPFVLSRARGPWKRYPCQHWLRKARGTWNIFRCQKASKCLEMKGLLLAKSRAEGEFKMLLAVVVSHGPETGKGSSVSFLLRTGRNVTTWRKKRRRGPPAGGSEWGARWPHE